MKGYLREDGRKGIRNQLLVVYLVECAHHVAREISYAFRDRPVQLIGCQGCYPNTYAAQVMSRLCTHPNTGGVLIVSLGCESFNRTGLRAAVETSGRPVKTLVIQKEGGTRSTIEAGRQWVQQALAVLENVPTAEMNYSDLIVGTICGGSDTFSGITANPAVGLAFDQLIDKGATAIFEETVELIGCEDHMAARAVSSKLGDAIIQSVDKAARHSTTLGHGSFALGNAEGGLTTQEEKSLGAYAKSGTRPIRGLIKPGDFPEERGLYLLDLVSDGEVRFGFPNINDNSEIADLISCGSHLILFTTGRGSVVGSAISPVIKICSNPQTYQHMSDDMDINAGRLLDEDVTLDQVGDEIVDLVTRVAGGEQTCSEVLGHQEFTLSYKSFEPTGPACFPGNG